MSHNQRSYQYLPSNWTVQRFRRAKIRYMDMPIHRARALERAEKELKPGRQDILHSFGTVEERLEHAEVFDYPPGLKDIKHEEIDRLFRIFTALPKTIDLRKTDTRLQFQKFYKPLEKKGIRIMGRSGTEAPWPDRNKAVYISARVQLSYLPTEIGNKQLIELRYDRGEDGLHHLNTLDFNYYGRLMHLTPEQFELFRHSAKNTIGSLETIKQGLGSKPPQTQTSLGSRLLSMLKRLVQKK